MTKHSIKTRVNEPTLGEKGGETRGEGALGTRRKGGDKKCRA